MAEVPSEKHRFSDVAQIAGIFGIKRWNFHLKSTAFRMWFRLQVSSALKGGTSI